MVTWSPPGSSVHGTLQTRLLEWAAISFSRGSSRPRDQTCLCWQAGSLPPAPPGKPASVFVLFANCPSHLFLGTPISVFAVFPMARRPPPSSPQGSSALAALIGWAARPGPAHESPPPAAPSALQRPLCSSRSLLRLPVFCEQDFPCCLLSWGLSLRRPPPLAG